MSSAFERVFATPQQVDLAALSAACGARYTLLRGLGELSQLLTAKPDGVEAIEAPIDRSSRRALDQAIQDLAATI